MLSEHLKSIYFFYLCKLFQKILQELSEIAEKKFFKNM